MVRQYGHQALLVPEQAALVEEAIAKALASRLAQQVAAARLGQLLVVGMTVDRQRSRFTQPVGVLHHRLQRDGRGDAAVGPTMFQ